MKIIAIFKKWGSIFIIGLFKLSIYDNGVSPNQLILCFW